MTFVNITVDRRSATNLLRHTNSFDFDGGGTQTYHANDITTDKNDFLWLCTGPSVLNRGWILKAAITEDSIVLVKSWQIDVGENSNHVGIAFNGNQIVLLTQNVGPNDELSYFDMNSGMITRQYLLGIQPTGIPVGLAFDGANYWYVDNDSNDPTDPFTWAVKISPTGAELARYRIDNIGLTATPGALAFNKNHLVFRTYFAGTSINRRLMYTNVPPTTQIKQYPGGLGGTDDRNGLTFDGQYFYMLQSGLPA